MKLARLASAIAGVVLLILMLGPREWIEPLMPVSDGAAHAIAFFLVSVALLACFPRASRLEAAASALAFGVLMELVQALVGRGAQIDDLIANALGILIATIVWFRRRLI